MSKKSLGYLTVITLVIIAVIAIPVINFSNDHTYTITITDKERVTAQLAKDSIDSKYLIYGEGLSCPDFEMYYPEKAVKAVQRWSDEHPQKTYLTELLKHYPNIPLDDDGAPKSLCPHALGLVEIDDCDGNCVECWNQSMS